MNISYLISKRIRYFLKHKGYTQYKLEMLSGISHGTMSCLMSNRYEGVNLKTLFIILQSLNVSILEFFNCDLFADLNALEFD